MPDLLPQHTPTASVTAVSEERWRLEIPAGSAGAYRLAQLDDYTGLPRQRFTEQAPFHLHLRARVSSRNIPGTWGFGLWNNPFGIGLGFGGSPLHLPCLPNTAWFFFASPENYLSFRDDQPAQGFLAQVFSAPRIPSGLSPLGLLSLPLLLTRRTSRWLRAKASRVIREQSQALSLDPTDWHLYSLEWSLTRVTLRVDAVPVLDTPLSPRGPLGLVLWIDNQYAAWRPDGQLGWGILPNPASWLEIENIQYDT